MPMATSEEKMIRIKLVRYYSAQGKSPLQMKFILEDQHEIKISLRQIYQDIQDLRDGKFQDSYLDDLLDVHYPEIFRQTMDGLTDTVKKIKEIIDLPETPPRTKVIGLTKMAEIQVATINALHKGPIVRELRKVRQRSRKLVEELAAERAITRKNDDEAQVVDGKNVVELQDETDPVTQEEITTPEQKEGQ